MSTKTKNKPVIQAGKEPEESKNDKDIVIETKDLPKAEAKVDDSAPLERAKEEAKEKKDEERKVARDKKEEERKAAKDLRDKERAEKKAAKPQRTQPAHMAKVDSFRASLPPAVGGVNNILESAKKLSTGDLNILAAHISLEARARATATAGEIKLEKGNAVRIVSGRETKFIGKEGVVSRVNRIRCFVTVPGFTNDVYLFNSDVELLEQDAKTLDISEEETENEDDVAAANG